MAIDGAYFVCTTSDVGYSTTVSTNSTATYTSNELWLWGNDLAAGTASIGDLNRTRLPTDGWGPIQAGARYQFQYQDEVRKRHGPAQRKALRLLRSFLTEEQRTQLRRHRDFTVEVESGNRYRLIPTTHAVHRLKRFGTRWYSVASYCLHPSIEEVPRADVTVGHLLWLLADEAGFRKAANETPRRPNGGWDGAWRRQLNARRRGQQRDAA